MSENTLICPRCNGGMERGFVSSKIQSEGATQDWVEGIPERSIWTGLKTKDRDVIPVRTFRCVRCGYLESYARPDFR